MAIATYKDLCIDANDAAVLGRFWADTLGLTFVPHADGDAQLDGPTPQHRIWVNTVPEPVTVKQRVHIDVHAASTDEVLARGATPYDVGRLRWDVLRDPEGAELCVFRREEVPAYKLYFYRGEQLVKTFPVAIGSPDFSSPYGITRQALELVWNPRWTPPDSDWARGEKPAAPWGAPPLTSPTTCGRSGGSTRRGRRDDAVTR